MRSSSHTVSPPSASAGASRLPRDRDAGLDEVRPHGGGLAAAPFLAGAQEDGAAVGDDRRVVDVDRVGIRPVRRLGEHHLGTGLRQERAERLVLRGRLARVRLGTPAVGPPAAPHPPTAAPARARGAGGRSCSDSPYSLAVTSIAWRLQPGSPVSMREADALRSTPRPASRSCSPDSLPAASENLLVGLAPADDAAVYRLDDERALIFTTDFFPPMVDDPALFGAIAAANALNDVFAMGGKPLLALSIAAFPEELPLETVRAIFDAAAAKVQESGAVLAGGHTIRDDEPKYGLAVVGTVHPEGALAEERAPGRGTRSS